METSDPILVKKSRKAHPCCWCYEDIEAGDSYWKWFTYCERTTARMHPECYEAMHRADFYDEELPPPGTYRRGCWCEESKKFCECMQIRERGKEANEGRSDESD